MKETESFLISFCGPTQSYINFIHFLYLTRQYSFKVFCSIICNLKINCVIIIQSINSLKRKRQYRGASGLTLDKKLLASWSILFLSFFLICSIIQYKKNRSYQVWLNIYCEKIFVHYYSHHTKQILIILYTHEKLNFKIVFSIFFQ